MPFDKSQLPTKLKVALDNPFHPLDLSVQELLIIYRRFEQSRQINRNPKQQLSIDVISQLIASLKGCAPSYVQQVISQAFIKQTLSWNDFLSFLDQESEVREHILSWLIHEKTEFKYKLVGVLDLRSSLKMQYEFVTSLNFITIGEEELRLLSIDRAHIMLLSILKGVPTLIDHYVKKTDRVVQPKLKEEGIPNISAPIQETKSKIKIRSRTTARSYARKDKFEQKPDRGEQLNVTALTHTAKTNDIEEDAYYAKERRAINSVFNLFKDLPLEPSISLSKMAAQRLTERTLTAASACSMRDNFTSMSSERSHQMKKLQLHVAKPLEQARKMLSSLKLQKAILSYNPHLTMQQTQQDTEMEPVRSKKLLQSKQLKERAYFLEAIHQIYNQTLRCVAVVYYNLDVVLVKVVREYSKISLEEQDCLRINQEKDHKKNEIIQGMEFYFHSITSKWFLLILVRVQFKNEYRNANQSYIRAYEIILVDNKRRSEPDCRFKIRKEKDPVIISLGFHQTIALQVSNGLHIITVGGRYIQLREEYIQESESYFKIVYEQKFKGARLSLSCLWVSEDKVLFGTLKGLLVLYDTFSHQFKMRKISNSPIMQVMAAQNCGYVLNADEKMCIIDLTILEEVQHFSLKNQEKLHEKIKRFTIHRQGLYCFGSEAKLYRQQPHQLRQHQQRRLQTMYSWRQQKLRGEPRFVQKSPLQLVIEGGTVFVALSEILEAIIVDKKTLTVKQSLILNIPYDAKVMKMTLSEDEKLLGLLLFNQHIYIVNLYTQEVFQHIRPTPTLKPVSLAFLGQNNEYLLAIGTESGRINLVGPTDKTKSLSHHQKCVHLLKVFEHYLLSCSEDGLIAVWALPFNFLKQDLKIPSAYVLQTFGNFNDTLVFKCSDGTLRSFNTTEGLETIDQGYGWTVGGVDGSLSMLFGVSEQQFQALEKRGGRWKCRIKLKINSEVLMIGSVNTEKAVVFYANGQMSVWPYESNIFSKQINLIPL